MVSWFSFCFVLLSGKSSFLKPLMAVFGEEHIFLAPGKSAFPLVDLPGKKVVFLDDWRFDERVLSFADQCKWYDGSAVTITLPQNRKSAGIGHSIYRGTAPIFATTRLDQMEELQRAAAVDPSTGRPVDAEASMLWRRLRVFPFTARAANVHHGPRVPYCGSCFARLVLQHATM